MERNCRSSGYIPYQPAFEQMLHYRNFVVPSGHPLFGIVSDFYQFDSASADGEVCVIPDGCMDLLFRYGGGDVSKTLEGYHRKKVVIPVNQIGNAFGVRFVPGELANLIHMQSSELIGDHAPLTDFLKKDPMLDRMDQLQDFDQRIETISGYLFKLIQNSRGTVDIVRYCTDKIINSQGNVHIRELSEDTGYSIRYLRVLYHRYVGVSPKELCEIIQFQNSFFQFALLQKEHKDFSLCDIAAQGGYYDQSHMNKSYRRMAGSLPGRLFSEISR
ncbi:MAG TPA: helix-turn-helix domain-containing protein [Anaerovoracaceae bacterium]|nr:helix-turn-helix domain-containing protein [Anaerovoracaceae bacterium]